MQQGRYPVGYLLLWQNGLTADRAIGTDAKQKPPRLVIVDGQQRLTSLYAVVKGVPVVRYNYDSEQIRIAFNPLEERFEVHDAAIQRDKSFIPDISTRISILALARSQGYTPAAPNTTSFRAEPCTSPPPVGARARPSAHRR